jgi:hypothetical protein
MSPPKRCSCGLVHGGILEPGTLMLPIDDPVMAGFYSNCACGSTLYYPWDEFMREVRKLDGTDFPEVA